MFKNFFRVDFNENVVIKNITFSALAIVVVVGVLSIISSITTYAVPRINQQNPSTYSQSAYRWFNNQNGSQVSTPLAALNTAATAPAQGTPFRLRMNLHVDGNNLAKSGQNFKLQFAGKGAGSCAVPSGTPSSYTDVTTNTAIKYYDNSLVVDGGALTANANDPTHSSDVLKRQTYEELNNFTNSVSAINMGQDGMWDFALADNTAPDGTSYCFRAVKSDGSVINAYSQYPEINIITPTLTQSAYRLFDNSSRFDNDGVVDGVSTSTNTRAIAKDSDSLYIAGNDSNGNWRIEKRDKTTGALVTSFDGDGVVDGVSASNLATSLTIDTNYLYVVGEDATLGGNWRIEKRDKTTGALVTSFDNDGVVDGVNSTDTAYAVTIDADSLYIAGNDSNGNWRIEKRDKTTGALVTSFDGDGVASGGAMSGTAFSLTLEGNYLYIGGDDLSNNFRVEKRDVTTGALVNGFGSSGVVTGVAASDAVFSIAIDSNYFYVVGDDINNNWRIEKRDKTTGALVTSFDSDGVVDGVSASDGAFSLVIDDGYIYVAGEDDSFGNDWRIEKRDKTTGALVTSFDGDGVVDGVAATNTAYTLAIDGNYLYIGGSDASGDSRIEKRDKTTGALVDGTASYDVGAPLAELNSAATIPTQGTPFRLRMNLHVADNNLLISGQSFKLQFAGKGAGTCTAPSGIPSSYIDVTATTDIKFYDNALVTDGVGFVPNPKDPTHSSDILKHQTYKEANNFTNSVSAVNAGEDGIWDFALVDNTAATNTNYCFRTVKSDGSALGMYEVYPEVVTN